MIQVNINSSKALKLKAKKYHKLQPVTKTIVKYKNYIMYEINKL